MSKEPELKPCRCGLKPEVSTDGRNGLWTIECANSMICPKSRIQIIAGSEKDAIREWNDRVVANSATTGGGAE